MKTVLYVNVKDGLPPIVVDRGDGDVTRHFNVSLEGPSRLVSYSPAKLGVGGTSVRVALETEHEVFDSDERSPA